jgi:hypothetical protein
MSTKKRLILKIIGGFLLLFTLGYGGYHLPFIHDRLAWRVEEMFTNVHNFFDPPSKSVFVPQATVDDNVSTIVAATFQALTPSSTPTCSGSACVTSTATCPPEGCSTATPGDTATSTLTSTPTMTPTTIPTQVKLTGIIHEYQRMNNCGPTNLAMTLSFWGWKGDQMTTAAFLRPGFNPDSSDSKDDKNVMPYEMVNFVEEETDLSIYLRTGGDLTLLKNLIAAGYPVLIEKGFEGIEDKGWMGHYEVVTGFDDSLNAFFVQDSYLGPDLKVTYTDMQNYWRAFDYTYLVIYPSDREDQVTSILGPQADLAFNQEYTKQLASAEVQTLTGRDLFFALFNYGSSLVALQDYSGAAAAYDQAYSIYPSISESLRPYRMTWYQTGPYFAYYYTGRYTDVINLATQTLDSTTSPGLEESWVWRARAYIALGDINSAIADLREALVWHPGFQPALNDLSSLGVTP